MTRHDPAPAVRALLLVAALLLPQAAAAQKWQPIGSTSTGNAVFVDPASIVRRDTLVTATVRVVFAKPTDTPKGPITGSRAKATFNCPRKTVAVTETILWHDERKGTIYEKRVPKQPGYGPVFTSNFSGVALAHLCGEKQ